MIAVGCSSSMKIGASFAHMLSDVPGKHLLITLKDLDMRLPTRFLGMESPRMTIVFRVDVALRGMCVSVSLRGFGIGLSFVGLEAGLVVHVEVLGLGVGLVVEVLGLGVGLVVEVLGLGVDLVVEVLGLRDRSTGFLKGWFNIQCTVHITSRYRWGVIKIRFRG